jgi:hypothetical protein
MVMPSNQITPSDAIPKHQFESMFLTGSTIRYARKAKSNTQEDFGGYSCGSPTNRQKKNECTSPERQGIAVGACGVIGLVGRSACCLDMVIADMVIADISSK